MNLHREILRLAAPSILANITVPLVGMVDMAVAGHLSGGSSAALIGGITIGSMLFDLLYWNFTGWGRAALRPRLMAAHVHREALVHTETLFRTVGGHWRALVHTGNWWGSCGGHFASRFYPVWPSSPCSGWWCSWPF